MLRNPAEIRQFENDQFNPKSYSTFSFNFGCYNSTLLTNHNVPIVQQDSYPRRFEPSWFHTRLGFGSDTTCNAPTVPTSGAHVLSRPHGCALAWWSMRHVREALKTCYRP